jgi:hypothetical protein
MFSGERGKSRGPGLVSVSMFGFIVSVVLVGHLYNWQCIRHALVHVNKHISLFFCLHGNAVSSRLMCKQMQWRV